MGADILHSLFRFTIDDSQGLDIPLFNCYGDLFSILYIHNEHRYYFARLLFMSGLDYKRHVPDYISYKSMFEINIGERLDRYKDMMAIFVRYITGEDCLIRYGDIIEVTDRHDMILEYVENVSF